MTTTGTPQLMKRVRPDWDRHAEGLRVIRFTDFSQLSPEARDACRAAGRRAAVQLGAITEAFRELGTAMERAGWAPASRSSLGSGDR